MSTRWVNNKDSLSIVAKNLIIQNLDGSTFTGSYASFSIITNMMVLLNSWKVLIAFEDDAILHIFLNPVVFDYRIRAEAILCHDMDTHLVASSDLVHNYIRVRTNCLYTNLALDEFRQLDFGFVTPLNFDTGSVYIIEQTANDAWLGVDTLKINTAKGTVEDFIVLNDDTAVPFRDNVHSSLGKVGKPTVRNLYIWIYRKQGSRVICFVSNEIATDEIIRRLWESDYRRKFLIESVWNRL
jgi:hypothetical protein